MAKRGRKKKVSTESVIKVPKVLSKYQKEKMEDLPKVLNSRKVELLGFCSSTECVGMITDSDLEEGKKTVVNCYRCGKRQKVKDLKTKEEKDVEKRLREEGITEEDLKRDYLDAYVDIPSEEVDRYTDEEWD